MATVAPDDLRDVLHGSPYVAYSYAYPHKTSYRPFDVPLPLSQLWEQESLKSLFLYLHIPFCEYRCGFCNLFTLARPDASLARQYLAALRREAEAIRASLPNPVFTRLAIGGGTPTFLTVAELAELAQTVVDVLGADAGQIPVSCEASPATIDAEKLALLRELGVDRLSLGIQSFNEQDAHAMGRPQRTNDISQALQLIREARFPTVNLDLIYGGETQTKETWRESIRRAVEFGAQEVYLYPLYVRPLTGLGRAGRSWDDWRLSLYRAGRDELLERGYTQVSMRMFSRTAPACDEGPAYCCQSDGMVGLGCGARSYTRKVHYSREYAVNSQAVAGILADYVHRADFHQAELGIALNDDEQRRRYLILSLLQVKGLDLKGYAARFETEVMTDYPELKLLLDDDLATLEANQLRLTSRGIERSDAIGPWLYSRDVRRRMEEYTWH